MSDAKKQLASRGVWDLLGSLRKQCLVRPGSAAKCPLCHADARLPDFCSDCISIELLSRGADFDDLYDLRRNRAQAISAFERIGSFEDSIVKAIETKAAGDADAQS